MSKEFNKMMNALKPFLRACEQFAEAETAKTGNQWVSMTFAPADTKGVRLKQGKFYRTKGGRKVYIATDDGSFCYGIINGNEVVTVYNRDGTVNYTGTDHLIYTNNDIAGEW